MVKLIFCTVDGNCVYAFKQKQLCEDCGPSASEGGEGGEGGAGDADKSDGEDSDEQVQ